MLLTLLAKVGIVLVGVAAQVPPLCDVGMFVIAAILAPPDVLTQTGLAVPLVAALRDFDPGARFVEPKPVDV